MIKIPNIIQLNDWEPKKFLRMMVSLHLALVGTIGFYLIGIELPILRQIIGFIYLTFVPGIIILRLLKLHKMGTTETIIFSAGLSVSFLMFSGYLLNTMLSFLNVKSPLSFWKVIIFITVLSTILCIISYKINRFKYNRLPSLEISRSAFYLILLPILSIIGTYIVNFQENNIVLMVLIILIAMIPVLIAFNKLPPELYPLAIFVIALSLLFHRSLISMHLTGWDIHSEYYTHKLIMDNAYWDSKTWGNLNAMLSIVILPGVYSYFLNMDGEWVFKIVYPLIFSLVPLGLYSVYKHQINNEKIAFFSVFFFMSFSTFYTEMLSLARQEIAELFFVLLIYLMVQDNINPTIRSFLLLTFSASLVTSHYGTSYIFMLLMIVIFLFSRNPIGTSKIKSMLPEFSLKKATINYFLAFYIIFILVWYMNMSNASAFKSIIQIGDHIYNSIFNDFFNPENRDKSVLMAMGVANPLVPSFGRLVHRDLQFITQFFIIIGFLKIIFSREFSRLKAEYFYLITAGLFLLFLSLLPNFANKLNMTRIYHLVLLAISPLFVIGCIFLTETTMKLINIKKTSKYNHAGLIIILGILIPYFLFNIGFIYEITNDVPTSISIGMERMKDFNITKLNFYNTYTPEQDVYGARWYSRNKDANKEVYADTDSSLHVLNSYGMAPWVIHNLFYKNRLLNETELLSNYYIYLGKMNVCENSFKIPGYVVNTSIISPLIDKSSKVYSNGCGEIYEN